MPDDRPALPAGMTPRQYYGYCIGGPLDGETLTSSSPWHKELIRCRTPVNLDPVPATSPAVDFVLYRHLYQPWRGPRGEYRDCWFWVVSGICEPELREILQQRFPGGPP